MCLAVPGKIMSIGPETGLERVGRVSFGGVVKEVSLAYVPEAVTGDYVIVHAGFALSVIDADEAERTVALAKEIQRRLDSGEGAE